MANEIKGLVNFTTGVEVFDADTRYQLAGATSAHGSSHTNGTDDIQSATASQKGLATAAQITKLDGIETGADVTDSANVDAAGAVMNSDTSTAGMSFVINENNFASNSSTKVPTQASTKAYIDGLVAGVFQYKGGYDASSNTPDLDVSPSGILKGDTYVVTVAGTFHSTSVVVGDSLIANQDSPTTDSHWTLVNRTLNNHAISHTNGTDDIQSATASQKGLMASAYASKLDGIESGADVTDAGNIALAIVGTADKTSPIDTDTIPLIDTADSNSLKEVPIVNLKTTILTNPKVTGDLILPKTSGIGIRVDTTTPTFGWRDLTSEITVRTGQANAPVFNTWKGGIRAFEFTAVNNEVFTEFHIPHDYLPGSDIFIHTHWSITGAGVTGSVTWGFETTYAKGHDQAAFGTNITTTIAQTAHTTAYMHRIAEVQLSAASPTGSQMNTNLLEVDGLIMCRCYMSAKSLSAGNPFLHFIDIHYQSTNMPTKQKAPNFYV